MIELRDYQHEAIVALESGWATGEQRLGVSGPTGVGKTVIFSKLSYDHRAGRVLIIVHREELVQQTVAKLRAIDRTMSVGVVKAHLNQGGAAVVVASIQTIRNPKRLAQIGRFKLIIVDEAHLSMSDSYQDVLRALGAWNPDGPRVAGFTATWSRSDNRGLGDFWQRIVFKRDIRWAVHSGHLVRPVGKRVVTDLDLSRVKRTGNDYNDGALGAALTDESIRKAIVLAYQTHAADRSGVLFAPTVDSATYFAEGLNAAGFRTEGLFGKTNKRDSLAIHERHRTGRTQILATCTRLAEGWDAPWCSAGIMARPTLHNGLFVQMVGRLLRPYPGKTNALVLDVVGVTAHHALMSPVELLHTPDREPSTEDDFDVEERLFDDLDDNGSIAEDGTLIDPRRAARVEGFEDVDLFTVSGARWLQTRHGIPFIRTRESLWFLWQQGDDRWAVGRCGASTTTGGSWIATDLSHGEAVEQISSAAIEEDSARAKRNSSRGFVSARMSSYAHSLGIVVPPGATRSWVSDAIDMVIASSVLDPLVTGR